jgi:hypothetical protein
MPLEDLPGSPRFGDNKSVDSLERAITTNYPPGMPLYLIYSQQFETLGTRL